MELPNLFFNEKEKIYFYVNYNNAVVCNICKKKITSSLVYHLIWMRKRSYARIYHINCLGNVHVMGFVDEFKTCVLVKDIPNDSLPVFERRPSFVNKSELNTFQVSEIVKNSEAEIKDRTRIAKNKSQSIMPEFERNLLSFKKREEELGNSFFICRDIVRDKQLQLEYESREKSDDIKEAVQNIANKWKSAKNKEDKPKRELFYNEEPQPPLINEVEFIDNFYSVIKESKLLLSWQEEKNLLSDESDKV